MRLRRLTGLERDKIEAELAELLKKIDYYKRVLKDEGLVRGIIKDELGEIRGKFQTRRVTRITNAAKDIDVEDLIADDKMVVTMTRAGYIKRMPVTAYRQQKRGGKGLQGVNLKEADFVEHLFVATNLSYMLFFSTKGKVYRLKVYDIPEASRHARGTAIVNLLPLEKGETIPAVISTKEFPADEFLMFATKQGMVKKTAMNLYDRTRRDGLIAINLKDGDELISVRRVAKGENVMMVSSAGKAILWDEDDVRPMGRGTMGVRGMRVPTGVEVLGMEIGRPGTDLFVITEKGYGKRTPMDEYPVQHRGGQGVFTIKMTDKKGLLAAMKIVTVEDELIDHHRGRRHRAHPGGRHQRTRTRHAGREGDEHRRRRQGHLGGCHNRRLRYFGLPAEVLFDAARTPRRFSFALQALLAYPSTRRRAFARTRTTGCAARSIANHAFR